MEPCIWGAASPSIQGSYNASGTLTSIAYCCYVFCVFCLIMRGVSVHIVYKPLVCYVCSVLFVSLLSRASPGWWIMTRRGIGHLRRVQQAINYLRINVYDWYGERVWGRHPPRSIIQALFWFRPKQMTLGGGNGYVLITQYFSLNSAQATPGK